VSGALAGCSASPGGDSTTTPGDDTPTDTTETATATPTPTPTTPAVGDVLRRMYRYDARHTNRVSARTHGDSAPTVRWTFDTDGDIPAAPATDGERVFVWSYDGTLYALSAADGTSQWTATPGTYSATTPAVVDGSVLLVDGDGVFRALDATDGSLRGRRDLGEGGRAQTPPVVADGTAYVQHPEGGVVALDVDGLEVAWEDRGVTSLRAPAVADDAVYVAARDGVVELDRADGSRRRTVAVEDTPYTVPVVGEEVVYVKTQSVGSDDATLHALSLSTGEPRWTAEERGGTGPAPALADGTAYVAETGARGDGPVRALDPATGEQQWATEVGGHVRRTPAVLGDAIYVGTRDGQLTALDAATGERRWSVDVGAFVTTSPATGGGNVYVGTKGGTLHALGW
jgi:outer membrane protein assembly factor BamB